MFIIDPYRFGGGGIVPSQSLSFDPSTDFLNMTDSNWGAYDRQKFAIIASIYVDSLAYNRPIHARFISTSSMEYYLEIETGGAVTFYIKDSASDYAIQSAAGSITTGGWFAIMVHFDGAAVTASDRMKMWINNSAITPSSSSSYPLILSTVKTTSAATAIGYRDRFGGLYMDGLIFAPSFFSGTLPTAADVFDGSSGKLKVLTGLTGLWSQADGTTATNDYLLTDWTNNGTVTTSATVP